MNFRHCSPRTLNRFAQKTHSLCILRPRCVSTFPLGPSLSTSGPPWTTLQAAPVAHTARPRAEPGPAVGQRGEGPASRGRAEASRAGNCEQPLRARSPLQCDVSSWRLGFMEPGSAAQEPGQGAADVGGLTGCSSGGRAEHGPRGRQSHGSRRGLQRADPQRTAAARHPLTPRLLR